METYTAANINTKTYNTVQKYLQKNKNALNNPEKRNKYILHDKTVKDPILQEMQNHIQTKTQLVLEHTIESLESPEQTSKLDLLQCTFIIPFKCDSNERLHNLSCLLNFISKHFHTNIFVFEQGETCQLPNITLHHKTNIKYYFLQSTSPFSRTIISNFLIQQATTELIVINDTDCFTVPNAYVECMNKMIHENFHILHPYGTPPGCSELTTKHKHTLEQNNYDISKHIILFPKPNHTAGIGGIVFIKRQLYHLLGNENHYFIGYSPEDIERVARLRKLHMKFSHPISTILPSPNNTYFTYPLFHMSHPRTKQSTILHEHYVSNELLWFCLDNMSELELIQYYHQYSNQTQTYTLQEYTEQIKHYLS